MKKLRPKQTRTSNVHRFRIIGKGRDRRLTYECVHCGTICGIYAEALYDNYLGDVAYNLFEGELVCNA